MGTTESCFCDDARYGLNIYSLRKAKRIICTDGCEYRLQPVS
jgi:hypothetical protein